MEAASGPVAPAGRRPGLPARLFFGAWKLWLGSVLSTFFLGSLAVIGWTARAARREALKSWWRRSPQRSAGVRFEDFAAGDAATAEFARWPNWVLGAPASRPTRQAAPPSRPGDDTPARPRLLHRLVGGGFANLRLGVQMAFNTWVLTLPGGLLWAVAWYAGWQNSFNKGYEHAWFGPSVFICCNCRTSSAPAPITLGSFSGRITSWIGGPSRRMWTFHVADPRPATGKCVESGSGSST
ncbi:MAG: hypothetical protein ACKVYV_03365, partial [Limisphaerales bacterium]